MRANADTTLNSFDAYHSQDIRFAYDIYWQHFLATHYHSLFFFHFTYSIRRTILIILFVSSALQSNDFDHSIWLRKELSIDSCRFEITFSIS